MTKKAKMHLRKRQLSPEEMNLLESGLEIETTTLFGNHIIIHGKKCDDGFRIAETKQYNFPFSIRAPISDEDVCIYNPQGTLSTRIHNQKIIYSI